MPAYIERDKDDNILTLKSERTSPLDIEVADAFRDGIYEGIISLANYKIINHKLTERFFIYDPSIKEELLSLTMSEDYPLDVESLLIATEKEELVFISPSVASDQYKEESFGVSIDGETINIHFKDFVNNVFRVSYHYTEESKLLISNRINHVYLIRRAKNIIQTRNKFIAEEARVREGGSANVINVLKVNGKITVPVQFHNHIAYYVNQYDRNEIVDIAKCDKTLDVIPDTIILIDDYELNVY